MAKDSRSKASNGGCTWVKLDTFDTELNELAGAEPVAAAYFRRLMARAESGGLGDADYVAPIGLRLKRLNRPWIAEFKAKDSADKRDLRLYWGEAPVEKQSLIACLVAAKPANSLPRQFMPMQDKHIGRAMDRLLAWCRQNTQNCRLLGKR